MELSTCRLEIGTIKWTENKRFKKKDFLILKVGKYNLQANNWNGEKYSQVQML